MALYIIVNILILIVLGLIARTIGKTTAKAGARKFGYTTRDIVILAVIAAIAGVINTGTGNVWYLANSSLGPLGGAALQGAFMWAYVLVMWLIRKPGAALLLGIIETAVEILMGNASGVGTLGWGLFQGIGIEAVMAMTGYRKFDLITAMCAGAGASQFGTVLDRDPVRVGPRHRARCLARHTHQPHFRRSYQRVARLPPGRAIGRTGLVRSAT